MLRKPIALVISLFLLVFSVPVVFAGTQTVTTTADNTTVDGSCSLREAITRANAGSSSADCPNITAAPNTIILPANTYTLGSSLPTVTTTIILQESGGDAIIQANASPNVATYRILDVNTGGSLTLDGVTVRNGGSTTTFNFGGCIQVGPSTQLTLQNGTVVEDCNSQSNGGGIFAFGSSVVAITNSTVRNNTSLTNGGGIDASGSLQVTNSTFSGNSLSVVSSTGNGFGGGISASGTLTVTGSTFTSNTNTDPGNGAVGGAIFISNTGTSTISGSTFTSNTVSASSNAFGGAIAVQSASGIVNISSSVFSGNQVNGSGNGGAVASVNGTINITTSRFQSNTAVTNGDAIYNNASQSISVSQSCITNNGDTAVFDNGSSGTVDATGGASITDSNWWGTSWGPRISAAGGGSAVSNGDSINGNGDTVVGNVLVDVNLSSAGDNSTPPTGAWLTVAPVVAGATCQTCSSVSGGGEPRACY